MVRWSLLLRTEGPWALAPSPPDSSLDYVIRQRGLPWAQERGHSLNHSRALECLDSWTRLSDNVIYVNYGCFLNDYATLKKGAYLSTRQAWSMGLPWAPGRC